MKKILTSIFAFLIASVGFGQSIHIWDSGIDVTGDTVIVPITAGSANLNDLELHNITTNIIHFQVNRTITPIDTCANLYYCTGLQCYSPHSQTTWGPLPGTAETIGASATLPSGPGTYGIAAHYDACPTICSDLFVLYRVYDTTSTVSDTGRVTLHYMCTSAIHEEEQAIISSSIFPNPSSTTASISYEMKEQYSHGKIVVYDMLGNSVKEIAIADKQGVARLNVSDLNEGVYFYSIVLDNKAITTQKLIVTSK